MKFVSSVLALSAILPIFLANASPLQERQPQDGEEPIPTEANVRFGGYPREQHALT